MRTAIKCTQCYIEECSVAVVFLSPDCLNVALYMRSLLLVESFDLGTINQYVFVREMCLCSN
jgi:hypothetical protein